VPKDRYHPNLRLSKKPCHGAVPCHGPCLLGPCWHGTDDGTEDCTGVEDQDGTGHGAGGGGPADSVLAHDDSALGYSAV
jgi:hypothetical protein